MDPFKGSNSNTNTENPIATCTSMLSLRQFSACSDFARRYPLSDSIARILTIADVLSASDLYSVLRLRRSDAINRDLARQHYAKLAILLDPTSTEKFPFSDEALARVREAWHVLSDPERRELYDREVEGIADPPAPATFWTACPYCWNLYQYEKKYEGCSLQCQSCQKAFHGVAVKSPEKDGGSVVEGDERRQYYWCRSSVPLKFYELKEKDENFMGKNSTHFVYVSDNDDDFDVEKGLGKGGDGVNIGGVRNGGVEFQDNGKRKMRIKTVAKRAIGNRRTRRANTDNDLDLDLDLDLDVKDGELEFVEGDDDVFVGVRFEG